LIIANCELAVMSEKVREDPVKMHKDANALMDAGKFEEARDLFLKTAELYRKGQNYFDATTMLYKAGECSFALKEYEKAILWRDAAYKLKNKLDIYDTINAIDLLRIEIPHEEVEKTIEEYKDKYRKIRGGQPEQRGA